MINKVLKEYVEKDNNMVSNYNKIMQRANEKKNWKKSLINSVAAILTVVLVGAATPPIYANIVEFIRFQEYQNREYKYGYAVKEETEEKINMGYIEQDGIKAKVDSLITTDDHFETEINFVFADNVNVNSQTFEFGYAIYDDENNIYDISGRTYTENEKKSREYYEKNICKELGTDTVIAGMYSSYNVSASGRNIISRIELETLDSNFPKSKKIYIRIFDLHYYLPKDENGNYIESTDISDYVLAEKEYFDISNAEWIFEINVPESIYNRESVSYKILENIPGIEISSIAKLYIDELMVTGKFLDNEVLLEKNEEEIIKDVARYEEIMEEIDGYESILENLNEEIEKINQLDDEKEKIKRYEDIMAKKYNYEEKLEEMNKEAKQIEDFEEVYDKNLSKKMQVIDSSGTVIYDDLGIMQGSEQNSFWNVLVRTDAPINGSKLFLQFTINGVTYTSQLARNI